MAAGGMSPGVGVEERRLGSPDWWCTRDPSPLVEEGAQEAAAAYSIKSDA